MIVQTSRFGAVEITNDDLISFPEGLLGFADLKKFVLLDDPIDEIFAWLQCVDDGQIAFAVLEPELFVPNYKVQLSRHDMEALLVDDERPARFFSIVTIPEDPTLMTANLKAPIVLNPCGRIGRQCVLQDNSLAIREPIFSRLQQRVIQNPSQPLKTQAVDLDMVVKLPTIPTTVDKSNL